MEPVSALVRFQFSLGQESAHMTGTDTLDNALLHQFIRQFVRSPMTDGATISLRRGTGEGIELRDLLKGKGGWCPWSRGIL